MARPVVVRGTNPFPSHLMNHMQYTETLVAGGATVVNQDWNGNSVYDPNASGVGHQPYGYGVTELVYAEYLVHAARCTVTVLNRSTDPLWAQIYAGPDADVTITAIDTIAEMPFSKTVGIAGSAGGPSIKKLSLYIKTKWMADQEEKEALMGDDWDGSVGANPTRKWLFRTVLTSGAATNVNAVIKTDLDYYVEWYQAHEAGLQA